MKCLGVLVTSSFPLPPPPEPSSLPFRFSIFWFLPIPASYPSEFVDTIHGYRLPNFHEGDRSLGFEFQAPYLSRDSELTPLTLKEEEECISDALVMQIGESINLDHDSETKSVLSVSRNSSSSSTSGIGTTSSSVPLSNGKQGISNVRKRVV
jgi:hypothetical protein